MSQATMSPPARQLRLLAVFDGRQWASICRDLDIASAGRTADEALDTLEAAVRDALAYERESGVSAGAPVSDEDIAGFLDTAHAQQPPAARLIFV